MGVLAVVGGLSAGPACAATPLPHPARRETGAVPLRDTSDDFGWEKPDAPRSLSTDDPGERGRPRTVEAPPAPQGHGRLIDLDVRDADIQEVFRLLADVGHVNLVVADEVHGNVTVVLKRVPWDQALDVIAEAKGLRVVHGDVIVVKPASR
jgi:type IV pilus assembly protein PilQ